MKEFQSRHVDNLPDAYRKDANSNNYKILLMEKVATNGLRSALSQIESILELDKATGKTLDLYGERVGQERGAASDQQYLVMIKAKIMQNLCNCTHGDVVEGLAFVLSCDPSEIVIEDGTEPCSVEVKSLPLGMINKAGFNSQQVVALIKRMLPCGCGIYSLLFDGTLEFADGENWYDEGTGFAISETDQSIGGYFGATQGDESDVVLPI